MCEIKPHKTKTTDNEIAIGIKDEYGVVYSADGTKLLKCENTDLIEYQIKDGTKIICDCAFEEEFNNGNLQRITLPNSVISIGESVFCDCRHLQQINIPDSVLNIGKNAFECCSALNQIIIPSSVTQIEGNPFCGCNKINIKSESKRYVVKDKILIDNIEKRLIAYFGFEYDFSIPDSVTTIGSYSFAYNNKLRQIIIPNSIKTIDNFAFRGCSMLESVYIPDSVTSIGDAAFIACVSLRQITIPDSIVSIGNDAFTNCWYLQIIIPESSVDKYKKMLPKKLWHKLYCLKKVFGKEIRVKSYYSIEDDTSLPF